MSKSVFKKLVISFILMSTTPAGAQLNKTFAEMFNKFLRQDLFSIDPSSTFFDRSAILADSQLRPALNNLISGNISSFPLPSTVAGITFGLRAGRPEIYKESLGPIYAETAETVGQWNLNFGFNIAHYALSEVRGVPLDALSFMFFTDDVNEDGQLGGPDPVGFFFETETMQVLPDLHLDATSFVLFATLGLTDRIDFGFAIPITTLEMSGEARALLSGTTFHQSGVSNYSFRQQAGAIDFRNPILEDTFSYDKSSTGIGDISLRLKYRFLTSQSADVAGFLDVSLPTGDEANYLGTGSSNVSVSLIVSNKLGGFTPHLNFGYQYHGANFDSDEIEFIAGFDHKLSKKITFALDVLGRYDLQSNKIVVLPGKQELIFSPDNSARFAREIDRSNVPRYRYDNLLDAAIGLKIAPTNNLLIMANILTPLQDGGLRSNVVAMVGTAFTF
ncbi:MAG: transporter [bacterium]